MPVNGCWRAARSFATDRAACRKTWDGKREPLPKDAPDAAIVIENDEILAAIEKAARSELEHIERALERLDEGVFGLCETCGAEIEDKRLKAVPYATQCRGCAGDA